MKAKLIPGPEFCHPYIETLNEIKNLQAKDQNLEQRLSRCAYDYRFAVEEDFGGAVKKLNENAYKELQTWHFMEVRQGLWTVKGRIKIRQARL